MQNRHRGVDWSQVKLVRLQALLAVFPKHFSISASAWNMAWEELKARVKCDVQVGGEGMRCLRERPRRSAPLTKPQERQLQVESLGGNPELGECVRTAALAMKVQDYSTASR